MQHTCKPEAAVISLHSNITLIFAAGWPRQWLWPHHYRTSEGVGRGPSVVQHDVFKRQHDTAQQAACRGSHQAPCYRIAGSSSMASDWRTVCIPAVITILSTSVGHRSCRTNAKRVVCARHSAALGARCPAQQRRISTWRCSELGGAGEFAQSHGACGASIQSRQSAHADCSVPKWELS